MKRFLLLALLVLALGGGAFVYWMNSASGAAVELSEAELEAARDSGEGARAIQVDMGVEAPRLPTMEDLQKVTDRERLAEWVHDVRRARTEAEGEDRHLLTVLLAEAERLRGNVAVARELAAEGAEALPSNSRARQVNASTLLSEIVAEAGDGGFGAVLRNLGKVKTYKAELRAAVELDPANCDARVAEIIVLAFAPFPVGSKKKAAALVEELGAHDELRRDFWRATLVALDEDRLEEALGMFQALAEEHPDDPDVLYTIGDLLGKLDRWEEAVAQFDRLLGKEPLSRQGYNALYQAAKGREKLGTELEQALSMLVRFERADPVGELMPSMDRVKYHQGRVLEELGRLGEARKAYLEAQAMKPGEKRVDDGLARVEGLMAARDGDEG